MQFLGQHATVKKWDKKEVFFNLKEMSKVMQRIVKMYKVSAEMSFTSSFYPNVKT